MSLIERPITELRGIALNLGINGVFSMDKQKLLQEIASKQAKVTPAPVVVIETPQYDARLMTEQPMKMTEQEDAVKLLKPLTDRGLKLTFPDAESWQMTFAGRVDGGTIRMPLRDMLRCAERLFVGK